MRLHTLKKKVFLELQGQYGHCSTYEMAAGGIHAQLSLMQRAIQDSYNRAIWEDAVRWLDHKQ